MIKRGPDGKLYTVDEPKIDLERIRRETRARIDGTEQFHVDEFAAPAPAPAAPEPHALCSCIEGIYLCDWCRGF